MKLSLKNISKAVLLCTVAVLVFSFGVIYMVSAENQNEIANAASDGRCFFAMRGWGMPLGRWMEALTEEQRNELASEIQNLISSKFEEWGIEPPEPLLSDEQRSELQAGIEQLREDGATPEDIKEYVAGKMDEWGVELPEMPENACRFRRRGRFMNEPFNGMWKHRFNEETS